MAIDGLSNSQRNSHLGSSKTSLPDNLLAETRELNVQFNNYGRVSSSMIDSIISDIQTKLSEKHISPNAQSNYSYCLRLLETLTKLNESSTIGPDTLFINIFDLLKTTLTKPGLPASPDLGKRVKDMEEAAALGNPPAKKTYVPESKLVIPITPIAMDPESSISAEVQKETPVEVAVGGGDHWVKANTFGDHRGDEKDYFLKISRPINDTTREIYKAEAILFTPAKRGADWHDTGTCTVGYGRTGEHALGAWELGAAVGMTNGLCKDELVNLQNWYHKDLLGLSNLRQSPASTGGEPFAGLEGKFRPGISLGIGDSKLGISLQPQVTAYVNSLYGKVQAGPQLDAHAGGVALTIFTHGDITAYDRRNVEFGPQVMNGGVTATLNLDLSSISHFNLPGSPSLTLKADQLLKTTMPGVNSMPAPQITGSLNVNF